MRRRGWVMALTALLCLSGCAQGIPTSGPVEQVSVGSGVETGGGVEVAPEPPVEGGSPALILTGFLTAVSSSATDRFNIAKQYLTPQAAETWDPASETVIYDSEGHDPITTDSSAVLQAPIIGRIDAQYRFQATDESNFQHNFELVQVAGQWRISNPGAGIFVSKSQFERSFTSLPVWFLDRNGDRLVAEDIYVNSADASPSAAIRALLQGPSEWLDPAVSSAAPADAKLAVASVPVSSNGVAEVSFNEQIDTLSNEQRRQLVAQVLWTLASFDSVLGVRITIAGAPFSIPGQDSNGVTWRSSVASYRISARPNSDDVFFMSNDQLNRVASATGEQGVTASAFGSGGEGSLVSDISVAWDGSFAVGLSKDRTRLYRASLTSNEPAREVAGGGAFIRPQVDDEKGIWAISNGTGAPTLSYVAPTGTTSSTPITELAGAHVVAFRVSPDQTRVVLVVERDGVRELGLMRLRGADQLNLEGWAPLTLNTGRGVLQDFADVAWSSDIAFVVLGALTSGGQRSVYLSDLGGASVSTLGPSSDAGATQLACLPRLEGFTAMLLTSNGHILRFEDRLRWTEVALGAAAISYPG